MVGFSHCLGTDKACLLYTSYQALQYSERLLSNIFKCLPIGIELYDMDGVLVDLNDKELEMFHIEKKRCV